LSRQKRTRPVLANRMKRKSKSGAPRPAANSVHDPRRKRRFPGSTRRTVAARICKRFRVGPETVHSELAETVPDRGGEGGRGGLSSVFGVGDVERDSPAVGARNACGRRKGGPPGKTVALGIRRRVIFFTEGARSRRFG